MNAVIRLDVPDWQVGKDVTVFFPDTMMKKGKCEKEELRFEPAAPGIVHDIQGIRYECGGCRATLWVQKDTVSLPYNMRAHRFCSNCGRMVKMGD